MNSLLIDELEFSTQKLELNLCDTKQECWADIPGYEGLYQASTLGRIRTTDGKTTSNALYPKRVWKQRIMRQKTSMNAKGRTDARVELWKDGNHKTWLVARLVGLTWCDGFQEGMTINHKDGNQLNNNSDNLEWITLRENIQHGFKSGLYPSMPVTLESISTGQRFDFYSRSEASRFLNRNHAYIDNCIRHARLASSANGAKYRIILPDEEDGNL